MDAARLDAVRLGDMRVSDIVTVAVRERDASDEYSDVADRVIRETVSEYDPDRTCGDNDEVPDCSRDADARVLEMVAVRVGGDLLSLFGGVKLLVVLYPYQGAHIMFGTPIAERQTHAQYVAPTTTRRSSVDAGKQSLANASVVLNGAASRVIGAAQFSLQETFATIEELIELKLALVTVK